MIYITGDCHGEFERFSKKHYGKFIHENDIVIVTGDFGLLWVKNKTFEYWKKFIEQLPFTICWVAGNHENYHWLYEYPIEEWNGGKVRKIIGDKCIYLERGQVFTLEGKTFFTFGGAASHDIKDGILDLNDIDFHNQRRRLDKRNAMYRVLNVSWWNEELPTQVELDEGIKNLEKIDYSVDFVISHCCSSAIQNKVMNHFVMQGLYETDILTDYFDIVLNKLKFRHWFFGHYHKNEKIDSKHSVLYTDVVDLSRYYNLPQTTYSKEV